MIIYIPMNIKDKTYHHSKELDFGGVIVDFNVNNQVIGVEILGADDIEKYDDYGNEIE